MSDYIRDMGVTVGGGSVGISVGAVGGNLNSPQTGDGVLVGGNASDI